MRLGGNIAHGRLCDVLILDATVPSVKGAGAIFMDLAMHLTADEQPRHCPEVLMHSDEALEENLCEYGLLRQSKRSAGGLFQMDRKVTGQVLILGCSQLEGAERLYKGG